MDFKAMKRKELQALCKKHGLPANSTNLQMAESLASLLQTHEKAKPKGCLKGSGGLSGEDVAVGVGVSKKVSFSVQEEKLGLGDFQRIPDEKTSPEKRRTSRRRSNIGSEPVQTSEKAKDMGSFEGPERVVEISVRTRRSFAVAMPVIRSPAVENKKAKEGKRDVRQNDKLPQIIRLLSEDEEDTARMAKEASGNVPTTRSLRHRLVVVGEDEGLPRNLKPRRTGKRENADKKEDDRMVEPLYDEAFVSRELGNDEIVQRKDRRKRPREAVLTGEDCASEGSEKILPFEDPPPRRSKRNLVQPKPYLPDSEKSGIDEDVEVNRTLVKRAMEFSIPESEPVTDTGAEEETERASQPIESSKGQRRNTFGRKKLRKQARSSTSDKGALADSIPVSEAVMETAAAEVLKGSQKLSEFELPPRRSSRNSSKSNALEHETCLPASGNPGDDNEAVSKNKLLKQARNRLSRVSRTALSRNKTDTVSASLEVQGGTQVISQFEEAPRRSRRNASNSNVSASDISFCVDGKSRDDVEVGRNRLQKLQTGRVLERQGVEASVPGCKNGAESLPLEVHEQLKNPPRLLRRNAYKHESHTTTVLDTVPDKIVERKKPKKRAINSVLEEHVSALERETGDEFGEMETQHKGVGPCENSKTSRPNTRRKSSWKVPVEEVVVQGECSPDQALSFLDVPKVSEVHFKDSVRKTSEKRQSAQKQMQNGYWKIPIGSDKCLEDQSISTGECQASLTAEDQTMVSGSNEIRDHSEYSDAFPAPANAVMSADLSAMENVSAETDGSGVVKKIVTEVKQPLLSDNLATYPGPDDQLQEVGDGILSEKLSEDGLTDTGFGSHCQEKQFDLLNMVSEVDVSLPKFEDMVSDITENVPEGLGCFNAKAAAEVEGALEFVSETELYVDDKDPVLLLVDCSEPEKQAEFQEARLRVVDVESTVSTIVTENSGSFSDALLFEDGNMITEAKNVDDGSEMAFHISGCSPDHTTDYQGKSMEHLVMATGKDKEGLFSNNQRDSRNEVGTCGAASATMLIPHLELEGSDIEEGLRETRREGNRPLLCGGVLEVCQETILSVELSVDSEHVVVGTGEGKNVDEKIITESRQSLPRDSLSFDLCPGEQVQERGNGISSRDISAGCLDEICPGTESDPKRPDPPNMAFGGGDLSSPKFVEETNETATTVLEGLGCFDAKAPTEMEGNSELTLEGKLFEDNRDPIASLVDLKKPEEQATAKEVGAEILASTNVTSEIMRDTCGAFGDALLKEYNNIGDGTQSASIGCLDIGTEGLLLTNQIDSKNEMAACEAVLPVNLTTQSVPLECSVSDESNEALTVTRDYQICQAFSEGCDSRSCEVVSEELREAYAYGCGNEGHEDFSDESGFSLTISKECNVVDGTETVYSNDSKKVSVEEEPLETAKTVADVLDIESGRGFEMEDEVAEEMESREALEGQVDTSYEEEFVGKNKNTDVLDSELGRGLELEDEVAEEMEGTVALEGEVDTNDEEEFAGKNKNTDVIDIELGRGLDLEGEVAEEMEGTEALEGEVHTNDAEEFVGKNKNTAFTDKLDGEIVQNVEEPYASHGIGGELHAFSDFANSSSKYKGLNNREVLLSEYVEKENVGNASAEDRSLKPEEFSSSEGIDFLEAHCSDLSVGLLSPAEMQNSQVSAKSKERSFSWESRGFAESSDTEQDNSSYKQNVEVGDGKEVSMISIGRFDCNFLEDAEASAERAAIDTLGPKLNCNIHIEVEEQEDTMTVLGEYDEEGSKPETLSEVKAKIKKHIEPSVPGSPCRRPYEAFECQVSIPEGNPCQEISSVGMHEEGRNREDKITALTEPNSEARDSAYRQSNEEGGETLTFRSSVVAKPKVIEGAHDADNCGKLFLSEMAQEASCPLEYDLEEETSCAVRPSLGAFESPNCVECKESPLTISAGQLGPGKVDCKDSVIWERNHYSVNCEEISQGKENTLVLLGQLDSKDHKDIPRNVYAEPSATSIDCKGCEEAEVGENEEGMDATGNNLSCKAHQQDEEKEIATEYQGKSHRRFHFSFLAEGQNSMQFGSIDENYGTGGTHELVSLAKENSIEGNNPDDGSTHEFISLANENIVGGNNADDGANSEAEETRFFMSTVADKTLEVNEEIFSSIAVNLGSFEKDPAVFRPEEKCDGASDVQGSLFLEDPFCMNSEVAILGNDNCQVALGERRDTITETEVQEVNIELGEGENFMEIKISEETEATEKKEEMDTKIEKLDLIVSNNAKEQDNTLMGDIYAVTEEAAHEPENHSKAQFVFGIASPKSADGVEKDPVVIRPEEKCDEALDAQGALFLEDPFCIHIEVPILGNGNGQVVLGVRKDSIIEMGVQEVNIKHGEGENVMEIKISEVTEAMEKKEEMDIKIEKFHLIVSNEAEEQDNTLMGDIYAVSEEVAPEPENHSEAQFIFGITSPKPADGFDSEVSGLFNEEKISCEEISAIDKIEDMHSVGFGFTAPADLSINETVSAGRDKVREEGGRLFYESSVISRYMMDEKEIDVDSAGELFIFEEALELTREMETKFKEASHTDKSLVTFVGEQVFENCGGSSDLEDSADQIAFGENNGRCEMEDTDHFAFREFDCEDVAFEKEMPHINGDEVVGKVFNFEISPVIARAEESKSNKASITAGDTLVSSEPINVNSKDAEVVHLNNQDVLEELKLSNHEITVQKENYEILARSICTETENVSENKEIVETLLSEGHKGDSQHPTVFTIGISGEHSPSNSEVGADTFASQCSESNGNIGLDQMQETRSRLINISISSAKGTSQSIPRTPMKLLDRTKCNSTNMKDKENTPMLKMERSLKRDVQKSALTVSGRRPLQSVQKNGKVEQ